MEDNKVVPDPVSQTLSGSLLKDSAPDASFKAPCNENVAENPVKNITINGNAKDTKCEDTLILNFQTEPISKDLTASNENEKVSMQDSLSCSGAIKEKTNEMKSACEKDNLFQINKDISLSFDGLTIKETDKKDTKTIEIENTEAGPSSKSILRTPMRKAIVKPAKTYLRPAGTKGPFKPPRKAMGFVKKPDLIDEGTNKPDEDSNRNVNVKTATTNNSNGGTMDPCLGKRAEQPTTESENLNTSTLVKHVVNRLTEGIEQAEASDKACQNVSSTAEPVVESNNSNSDHQTPLPKAPAYDVSHDVSLDVNNVVDEDQYEKVIKRLITLLPFPTTIGYVTRRVAEKTGRHVMSVAPEIHQVFDDALKMKLLRKSGKIYFEMKILPTIPEEDEQQVDLFKDQAGDGTSDESDLFLLIELL